MGYFSNNDMNYYNMNESERKEFLEALKLSC